MTKTATAPTDLPADVFADLRGMVLQLNPATTYTLGHVVAGAKAVLSPKGYKVAQHAGLVRKVLAAMEAQGELTRQGKRWALAEQAAAPKPAPKAPKAASRKALGSTDVAPAKFCRCGCGEQVNKLFRQGHDARLVSRLLKAIDAGELTKAVAVRQAAKLSDKLAAKVARGADLRAERKAAKAAAAKAAKK